MKKGPSFSVAICFHQFKVIQKITLGYFVSRWQSRSLVLLNRCFARSIHLGGIASRSSPEQWDVDVFIPEVSNMQVGCKELFPASRRYKARLIGDSCVNYIIQSYVILRSSIYFLQRARGPGLLLCRKFFDSKPWRSDMFQCPTKKKQLDVSNLSNFVQLWRETKLSAVLTTDLFDRAS